MRTEYGDDNVDLVPNSVDTAQFFASVRGKQSIPTVGFLYATTPFKGLDVYACGSSISTGKIPQSAVDLLWQRAGNSRNAAPGRCEFVFCPPQNQIRSLYSACDVWVTASRSEGFNLPAMEAMACRTPVVATRAGWPEEAVKSGSNGVLVDIDDQAGIAAGVEWVLSRSDQEWRNLSDNAYATATSGSWDESTAMFERALEHACHRSARGEIAGKCVSPNPSERLASVPRPT